MHSVWMDLYRLEHDAFSVNGPLPRGAWCIQCEWTFTAWSMTCSVWMDLYRVAHDAFSVNGPLPVHKLCIFSQATYLHVDDLCSSVFKATLCLVHCQWNHFTENIWNIYSKISFTFVLIIVHLIAYIWYFNHFLEAKFMFYISGQNPINAIWFLYEFVKQFMQNI
jgi:hypothetical protein